MKDFRLRTITETSTDGSISVKRTRTSDGYQSIIISVDNNLLTLEGDTLKSDALTLGTLLREIATNPCLLEEGGEEEWKKQ